MKGIIWLVLATVSLALYIYTESSVFSVPIFSFLILAKLESIHSDIREMSNG